MDMNRRTLIRALGAGLSLGLAGCSGSGGTGGDGETDSSESTPTDTETMDTQEATTSTRTDDSTTDTTTTTTSDENTETATATPEEDTATPTVTNTSEAVSFAIDNQGISAWVVSDDEAGVAGDGDNPTFTLEIGTRYTIENRARSAHPFALRAADDTPLLSQSADGTFEDNAAVDWVDGDSTLSFTFTEALAAEADYYICTVHPSMEGDIRTA